MNVFTRICAIHAWDYLLGFFAVAAGCVRHKELEISEDLIAANSDAAKAMEDLASVSQLTIAHLSGSNSFQFGNPSE